MRVVLDTNVFISALLFRGKLSRLVEMWRMGRIKLLVSRAMIAEYLRVLAYPKFELSKAQIMKIVQEELVPHHLETVAVTHRAKAVKEDPSDDKFLECAVSGKADCIVSGDAHLLELKSYKGIPIMTAAQFFSQVSG